MLIFVADLTTDPRRFPHPGPPRCFAHPRPAWWPYAITPPLYNGISNTLVLNPEEDEREGEKKRKNERERARERGGGERVRQKVRKGETTTGMVYIINNAKCLNIENSSAFPKKR